LIGAAGAFSDARKIGAPTGLTGICEYASRVAALTSEVKGARPEPDIPLDSARMGMGCSCLPEIDGVDATVVSVRLLLGDDIGPRREPIVFATGAVAVIAGGTCGNAVVGDTDLCGAARFGGLVVRY
jgi:hypothetical protein